MARSVNYREKPVLRSHVLGKNLGDYWTGRIAFVGVHGTGRNTLCERFGRLRDGEIKRCERRAYRELIIDHSKLRTDFTTQGRTSLAMDVIYFPEDGLKRNYNEIVNNLDGIVLMIDITEDEAGLLDAMSLLAKLMKSSGKKRPPYILVGNKKDICIAEDRSLEGGYKVKNYYEDGDNNANKIGAKRYFECSAKRNLYCLPLASYVLQNFIQKPDLRT